ncbi:DUF3267 domain-containing protein [Edaphobacillus lindanitolerans]|uniref:Putative zincin peptidase n=1 Tax=Edaphobacillus lindanitolerans TaxID=550447 RepID=A0A1U7PPL3_9BACI|nr:DUF3267 domain-containing protein [Edaphobacillus lindanitolerans]SIT90910.1 Putative zincin peptidase [Edaphobacillus lindanitolerans]
MHCWKTINVKKHYGLSRLFLLSSILMVAVFIISYISFNLIHDGDMTDSLFVFFLVMVFLLYPVHKAVHYAVLWRYRNRITLSMNRDWPIFPVIQLRVREPIPKHRFAVSLIMPFLTLNPIFIAGGALFPAFTHYFAALLAYHCGMCLIDLVYVKNLSRSPKACYIEETDSGYEILVPFAD